MGQRLEKAEEPMVKTVPMTNDQIPIDYETDSPRFSVANTDELRQGIEHLDEHGYAVFSDVLSESEVTHSIDLFWKHLEEKAQLGTLGIRRDDPKTWDKGWPGIQHIGLINEEGFGQSDFIWSVRGNPNIKKVFSQIWNSNELFVSFDGVGSFRDWHINKDWKTKRGWYHCDQNPHRKPNRCSIQGLVALTDSDETTGGLIVLPGSHKHFLDLKASRDKLSVTDYVSVPPSHPIYNETTPRLIKCKAGDLILWDSRCIHCNTVGIDDEKKVPDTTKTFGLLRLVCYVCMSPASMFVPDPDDYATIDEFRQMREKLVRDRTSCTHWPLETIVADSSSHLKRYPLKLNKYQHSLIIGIDVDPTDGQEEMIF